MNESFDFSSARDNLKQREDRQKASYEKKRIELLNTSTSVLQKFFTNTEIDVYLIGSILTPGKFNAHSDVDIVLKNFKGDRFEIWPQIENEINHKIEIILYENCSFQDHVDKFGMKVL